MRFKTVGNKADISAVVIKNAESSASIPLGTPICFIMNGTDDGLGVVLPTTGGSAKINSFAAGVAMGAYAAGTYGEAQVYGFCNTVLLRRQTRANSGADWSSNSDGFATGLLLAVDTANNAFSTVASLISNFLPFAVLAASVASWASTASITSDTRTVITVATKAFLRIM